MDNNLILREWDSHFFNRRIFFLESPSVENENNDWPRNSLITKKINSTDYLNLNALNKNGFSFVEGELVFRKNLSLIEKSTLTASFDNYLATESSLEEIKIIVNDLYVNSRYREPWFTSIERDNFYKVWIENAVLAKFDDCCLVLKVENTISGFVTIRIKESVSTIGLIGVAKTYQGQGVGKQLLELAQNYSIAKKANKIEVATQTSNVSAANLYIKGGFSIANISYWFYKQA